MTFEELLQKYNQGANGGPEADARTRGYEGIDGLYDDFRAASQALSEPLAGEVENWLDTLDMLSAQPPTAFEQPVRNALVRAEGLNDFLRTETDGVSNYQRMREAIQNRNGAEAAARFDEHLRAVNTYYELGMDLSYLPEPEVQPQVNEEQVNQPEVNEEQVNQPEVNEESVIQPEVQPEVNQAENETSGSESTEEADNDVAPYTYSEMVTAFQDLVREGAEGLDVSNRLADIIAFYQHTVDGNNGLERARISEHREEKQKLLDDDAFQNLTEGMDDEELVEACLNPEGFYRQLRARQAELEIDLEDEPVNFAENEAENTPVQNPENTVNQENTQETQESEGAEVQTYNDLMRQVREEASPDMTEERKIDVVALALCTHIEIEAGRGDQDIDFEYITVKGREMKQRPAFRIFIDELNNEGAMNVCKDPTVFLELMEKLEADLEKEQEQETKEPEKEEEKTEEKTEEKVEEKDGETVEEKKTEEIVEEKKTEETVEEKKTEEIVEEKKTEETVEEKKTENIISEKGSEEEIGESESYVPLYTERDISKDEEEIEKMNFGFTVLDADDFASLEEMKKTPAKTLLEDVKAEAKAKIEANQRSGFNSVLDHQDLQKITTRILAIRMVADAKRHDSNSLGKGLTEAEIREAEQNLLRNPHYKEFLRGTGKYSDTFDKLHANILEGHGGRVEDVFRNYLKELPAGELDNSDPALQHFMPTAAERIEALQEQAKAKRKEKRFPAREAAEIVVLRNLVHAEKGKKSSLQKPIPTTGSLQNDVDSLYQDNRFYLATDHKKVYDAMVAGHGGGLIEQVYKVDEYVRAKVDYVNSLAPNGHQESAEFTDSALTVLQANTRGGRMRELQAEAAAVAQQIDDAAEEEKPELIRKTKEIMAEYQIHQEACMNKSGQFLPNARKKLEEEVPWESVDNRMQRIMKAPRTEQMTVPIERAKQAMQNLAAQGENPIFNPSNPQAQQRPIQRQVQQGPQAGA